jgi:ABC-type Zn2+ transport system substrate-binding protein/surface adhesin
MIQCKDCEHLVQGPGNQITFTCDPFGTIKEPECLMKWQLLRIDAQLVKLDTMVRAYQATLEMYKRIAPLQEKMIKHMEREIDEADEADSWKHEHEDEGEDEHHHDDEEEDNRR